MDRGSQLDEDDEDDKEDEEDEEDEEERTRRRRTRRTRQEAAGGRRQEATDIKSNNPHLAGGEILTPHSDVGNNAIIWGDSFLPSIKMVI